MKRTSLVAAIVSGLAAFSFAVPAVAGSGSNGATTGGAHPKSSYYRKGPQVRGYTQRRGGYSYNYQESINTYGDSRSLYGGASSLRDPSLDKQTVSGPFDHGFFFDSGVGQRGGDSPYMN